MGENMTLSRKIRLAYCFPVGGMVVVGAMGLVGLSGTIVAVAAVAMAVIALLVGFVIGRQVRKAVAKVSEQAQHVADELPTFAKAVREGRPEFVPTLEGVSALGDDDLDELARSINVIGTLATEQARDFGELARQGVGDVFVSIMRRNQLLLDRQMALIDRLEASERDPDRLENLFTIDHLTTRIRRNSDSLLVLAGHGQAQPTAEPIPLHDVLRVAQAEVANFEIVEIRNAPKVMVSPGRAASLAHLVAELIENATKHAGDQSVAVDAEVQGDILRVSVIDGGPGMAQSRLDEINALLQEPPPVGLASGDWVGFNVVSRLAVQLDARVRLVSGAEGGLIAWIEVPAAQLLMPSLARPEPTDSTADEAVAGIADTDIDPLDAVADEFFADPAEPADEQPTEDKAAEEPPAQQVAGVLPSRQSETSDLDPVSDWSPGHTEDALPSRGSASASPAVAEEPMTSADLAAEPPAAVPDWMRESTPAPAPTFSVEAPETLDAALDADFDGLPTRGSEPSVVDPAVPALGASRRERDPEDVRSILSRYQRKDQGGTEGANG
ncbi:MAG: hypothetical protein HKN26_06285 [Acidimicrobiales bacterium]|nr:hypothetical protein [Acidimicrobiales bacterium]